MEDLELKELAVMAMKNSYSPYSNFKVGAALLTDKGIYTGCNIENSSYGATVCAERTAALKAVSEGARTFYKIAIVCSSGEPAYPCGICRQVLSEFAKEDFEVILQQGKDGIAVYKLTELLPFAFTSDCIK